MLRAPIIWMCIAALLVACNGSGGTAGQGGDAAGRESLLAQDRAFAEVGRREGMPAAYRQFLADTAVQLPDGDAAIYGKAAILENTSNLLDLVEFSLSWEPLDADVAASGDLGYTWGNYQLTETDESGEQYTSDGKYVTVWKRSNGDWKVVLDISNQNELPIFDDFSDWGPMPD